MPQNEFVSYILDLLSPYGNIKARAMFGGYSIYKDGTIVAIIVSNELYFKVDEQSSTIYEANGSKPFTYEANGKTVKMPYWQTPLNVMEDEELLSEWLNRAWQISLKKKGKNNYSLSVSRF